MATPNDAVSKQRLVHLRFKPLWLYVDKVREFCNFFAHATFEDEVLGERVGMVVHELVENAIKHGDERELEVRLEHDADHVVICVTNTADPARAKEFQGLFERQAALNASVAYAEALKRSVIQDIDKSGLGIPRIRSEGAMELKLDVTLGRVSLTARGTA